MNMDLAIALVTLTVLEVVLGVDNVIFVSILSGKLPSDQQKRARRVGLLAAMIMRLLLLSSIVWISRLTTPLFEVLGRAISGRDLILLGGGLFLLAKGTTEIHATVDGVEEEMRQFKAASFASVVVQIMILDIVFSLDSVITAVGMVGDIAIMIIAVMASVGVMMFAAKPIGEFVDENPTIKILALSFLTVVGILLIAEGFGQHVPKGYVYFGMAFSLAVELLNIRMRRNQQKLRLHKHMPGAD